MGDDNYGNTGHAQLENNGAEDPAGRIGQSLLFLKNFVQHPESVGWLLPSSRFLVNQVLKQVNWAEARVIVEYGPGIGSFTKAALDRLHPQGKLIAIELNPEFCEHLRRTIPDPRLHLVNNSATEIDRVLQEIGVTRVDCVISGIPFKTLPHHVRDEIVRKTHSALKPEGSFLVYQFTSVVLPYLERVFGGVSRDVEFLNLLPAQLFYCERSSA